MPFDLEGLLRGDRYAIARIISGVENSPSVAAEVAGAILPYTGKAHTIGITGPSGSGKSSLAVRLALEFRKEHKKVGIIAIDPSSEGSGGAFMGNRVRMTEAFNDKGIYIRSMASRGSTGGVCRAAFDAVNILDAAGMQYIIVETVGAGQIQTEITKVAQTFVVVLQPKTGDSIQASKAGLMEIGDIFVINKSDLPGAQRTARDIDQLWQDKEVFDWKPLVLKTVATGKVRGIIDLKDAIKEYYHFLLSSGKMQERKRNGAQAQLLAVSEHILLDRLKARQNTAAFSRMVSDLVGRKLSVYDAAIKLVSRFDKSS